MQKRRTSKPTHETNTESRARYRRNPTATLYRTPRWREARRKFLRQFPNCIACGGKADLIDHIEPHKGDHGKFWDASNWAPMCYSCHSAKTAKYDGGFGNKAGGDTKPLGQCAEDGSPSDPNHPWNKEPQ